MQRKTFSSTLHCGTKTGRVIVSSTCPDCRDVPEGDIYSPLTNWVCTCGRCRATHSEHCKERQLKRTAVRLVSLLYRLAGTFNTLAFVGIVDSYRDSVSFQCLGLSSARVLSRKRALRAAAEETPISNTLPQRVRQQAASVENCIGAISCLSPALAWLTKGANLTLRELNVAPRPVEQVVFWNEGLGQLHRPADIHTVLVVSPGPDDDRASTDDPGPWWEKVPDTGYVLDPTYLQYGFETAVQTTTDYMWTRVKSRTYKAHNTVGFMKGFGDSFRRHQFECNSDDYGPRSIALLRQICMLAMNNAAHREILTFGGSHAFLNSRHQQFCENQQLLERAVCTAVGQARAAADAVCQQHMVDVIRDLQELVKAGWDLGHGEFMTAFYDVRSG